MGAVLSTAEQALQQLPQYAQSLDPVKLVIAVPALSVLLWSAGAHFTSPLRKYPGPLLASWTNFYRMWYAYQGNMHLKSKSLHDKYGPVVRMAPNYIDVDYASLIKTCFDVQGVWQKTDWHAVSGAVVDGKLFFNIFSEVRADEHARIKKPIAKYFSPAGVAPLEPHVDAVITTLCRRIDESFASDDGTGPTFDFSKWSLYFSWDAVAKTTFSEPVGYLEKGYDFDGSIHVSEKAMDYLVTVGMYPVLDKFLDKNPVFRIGPPTFGAITNLGLGRLMGRMKGEDKHDPSKPDFLDRYLEAQQQHPEVVDVYRILSYILVNLAAGADTTAVCLRSIIYLSLKNPVVWTRLEEEILNAEFSTCPVSFSEARKLPYLEAVVRESLRYLPGNCFAQERKVPAGGLTLPDGTFVPEGTEIGFNAYVMHRNKQVWGPDAEDFNPDRWLPGPDETKDDFSARLLAMNNADLSFSAGSRKCIGMNVGKMEVYKTIATMIRLFDMELADPEKEWTVHNSIFPRQSGVELKIKRRENTLNIIRDLDGSY
ncbi:cytochrome p450 domain-containing protein [Sarocladium implicatum]|nr:cytochrome p450 domain-containing protein [Sarocladium implicatum]